MKKYAISSNFTGYRTKPDKTNTDVGVLVDGSQNVLINDAEKIETRAGYTLQSAEDTSGNPIESSFDWQTSGFAGSEQVFSVRSYDDELEVYLGTVDGVAINAWKRVADSWSAVDFIYAPWWDTSETLDLLLFVNGDSNIYAWGGGVAVADSTTSNTITKKGTSTWAENRFFTTANQTLVNLSTGNEHTYTGGEGTTTLTGLNNTTGISDGDILVQKVITNSNKPASGFKNDVIKVNLNQLWVGSNSDKEVYVSKDSDYTDFTFSSPRVPGDGALLTLDGICRGFAVFGEDTIVFAGRDLIYKSQFDQLDVSGTLTETLKVRRIKTTAEMAAQSQRVIAEIGDAVAFLTFEPELRLLSDIEEIESPQIRTISDPIRPDFDAEIFTNSSLKYYKNRLYLSAPANSKVYIHEFRENTDGNLVRFWQPPQVLPVREFAIINNAIHGHSNADAETFKLFNGTDDNDIPFVAKMAHSYNNFGDRVNCKEFDEWFLEGYISRNTEVKVTFNYDYEGSTQQRVIIVKATTDAIIFEDPDGAGILGQLTIGGGAIGGGDSEVDDKPKFAAIITLPPINFRELQVIYETAEQDEQFELLAHGPNVKPARSNQIPIKI